MKTRMMRRMAFLLGVMVTWPAQSPRWSRTGSSRRPSSSVEDALASGYPESLEIMKIMFAAGVDPSKPPRKNRMEGGVEPNHRDHNGRTPLMQVVAQGALQGRDSQLNVIRELLGRKVELDGQDLAGNTALHWAVPFTGKTFYVAATGDDGNPGTMEKPWKSFARSLERAEPNTRVLFRRGDAFALEGANVSGKQGPVLVGAYDDPKRPADKAPLFSGSGGINLAKASDWRFMDLHFRGLFPNTIHVKSCIEWGCLLCATWKEGDPLGQDLFMAHNSRNLLWWRLEIERVGKPFNSERSDGPAVVDCYLHDFGTCGYRIGPDSRVSYIGNRQHRQHGQEHGVRQHCLLNSCFAEGMPESALSAAQKAEILRVLAPIHGRAVLKDKTIVQSELPGSDWWTHKRHGPNNNPASRDTVFQFPPILQYRAMPTYTSAHGASLTGNGVHYEINDWLYHKPWMVSLCGRIFARNVYNGRLLWEAEAPKEHIPAMPTAALIGGDLFLADGQSGDLFRYEGLTGQRLPNLKLAEPDRRIRWFAHQDGIIYALIGGPADVKKPLSFYVPPAWRGAV